MKGKALTAALVLLAVGPLAWGAWCYLDSTRNRGLEFGYWGDFNRVRHTLAAMRNVRITRDWVNHDVALEEFGFDVVVDDRPAVALLFQEKDPVRRLSGAPLADGLAEKIRWAPAAVRD